MSYQTWASAPALGTKKPTLSATAAADVTRRPAPLSPHSRGSAVGARAPSLPSPARSNYESARRPRHEPAKVVGSDGKVRLRGVQSTSDIARYTKDIDPYSRKAWEIREAFKTMRSGQHASTATNTWSALHKWCASEKPIDQWYMSTKSRGMSASARVST
mmetsp:Transcript_13753/g.34884  ORF Transcript_13753/g.34884 Transcript_13753/m.34884 type:complete len:160 (+) Transcript_13753:1-480(+)